MPMRSEMPDKTKDALHQTPAATAMMKRLPGG